MFYVNFYGNIIFMSLAFVAIFVLFCCSDTRLCNRSLKEYAVTENMGEQRMETDSVHSVHQDDDDECDPSNLVYKSLCEKDERAECWPNDPVVDGGFAQDVEQMKAMGLPLSFTASKRREKKVYVMIRDVKIILL